MLQKVVGEREVSVVSNQRRAEKPRVRVVAARINPERRPVSPRAESGEGRSLVKQTLRIRFDDLKAVAVRVRRAERIRALVCLASCGPRGFCEDAKAERNVSKDGTCVASAFAWSLV